VIPNPEAEGVPEPLDLSAGELAAEYATSERFDAVATALRERGRPVAVEELSDRVVEEVVRENYARIEGGRERLDAVAFRSAVAERARAYLGAGN
jgi:hypothetical protein